MATLASTFATTLAAVLLTATIFLQTAVILGIGNFALTLLTAAVFLQTAIGIRVLDVTLAHIAARRLPTRLSTGFAARLPTGLPTGFAARLTARLVLVVRHLSFSILSHRLSPVSMQEEPAGASLCSWNRSAR
ncbi:MAG: hypothetical protein V4720_08740, partial [Pseudomonadota bacterium]